MKTSDFYYDLPQELIAQDPLEDRSASRLMVLDKKTGKMQHHVFKEIVNYLKSRGLPGDQRYEGDPGKTVTEQRWERMPRSRCSF